MTNDKEKMKRLNNATKKLQEEETQRREKTVQGSHLLQPMLELVAKKELKTEERTGFYKITGPSKALAVYLAKKGGRVDFSGFDVDAPALTKITKEEAQAKHIGKVRGQIDFTATDEAVLAAFEAGLTALANAPAPAAKVTKPKKEKATKAAKTDGEAETTETTTTAETNAEEQPAA